MLRVDSLEPRLIEALQPIRGFAFATTLYHFFETGLFDCLRDSELALGELAERHGMDPARLEALLSFLQNEGILKQHEGRYGLTARGLGLEDFRGWYTMLVGGYGQTFLQMGERLQRGSPPATRDAARVGVGSCAISYFDAIPLTRSLMARIPGNPNRLLDLGCGNALYLAEFCTALPQVEAWGVEPDPEGYQAAVRVVRSRGLESRIRLTCSTALDFFRVVDTTYRPDFIVLGFVLHELLGQGGEAAVLELLRGATERFQGVHLIVIEVDQQMKNPRVMRHGLAMAYYNAYYLLHPFTQQRLETRAFWDDLFARAGLEVLARQDVDPSVDSTGLEVGYLLRKKS
ncbi:2-ketoarginine methyltransferase [Polyangium mundeleinium]|uniref:2-ketoarginine methyltransferase n=1 Tax=Polyangium mundeleinium TaxID=2995306 RepID=A0ABT5F6G5_9BACT|nr:2-ketoarginine methyltransferase [Polyangium mundeleinium]MDC0749708.1 2-ketoarginine methyltransferase [Polyangium mundeleinium]